MLAMASADLSGFFRGKWRIHRTLAYTLGGPASATFDGDASFSEFGGTSTLLYEERGKLAFGGQTLEAQRRYFFCFDRDPPGVYFAEIEDGETVVGKFFHPLDLSGELSSPETCGAEFDHLCVNDLYQGALRLKTSDAFEWQWRVTGPKKDGNLRAEYSRVT